MDHILAKIKRETRSPYYKLISDHTLYDPVVVNLENQIQYDPDHNLDEDTWYKLEQFSQKEFCIDFLKEEFDSVNYDDLEQAKFSRIAYILSVQSGDVYFQKITPSLYIRRKIMAFGEVATIEDSINSSRLIINSLPDAVYFRDSDTLIFRNLATISSIFKGIDELYKEATNEEVEGFLDEPFVHLADGFSVENVSKSNRKRVALALATLESMSDDDRSNMFTYIDGYLGENKLNYDQENGKFEISTDDELKYLLYGIEQRFYTTPFGNERRMANSVQSLDH